MKFNLSAVGQSQWDNPMIIHVTNNQKTTLVPGLGQKNSWLQLFLILHQKMQPQLLRLIDDGSLTRLIDLVNHLTDYQHSQVLDARMESYQCSHQALRQKKKDDLTDDDEDDGVNENCDSVEYDHNDLEDHITRLDTCNANNKDVEFEDPLPDDIDKDPPEWAT